MPDLDSYLSEMRELACGENLALVAAQVAALGDEIRTSVSSLGVRFELEGRVLCELSPFGELFIVRIGPQRAIEYRVRNQDVAFEALDRILHEYLRLRHAISH